MKIKGEFYMTTRTLIDILENRLKACKCNPTEAQLLVDVIQRLKKLLEIESSGADDGSGEY